MKSVQPAFTGIVLSGLILVGLSPLVSGASLPESERPGVADIVEQVTPGVVNVAVSGRVAQQANPLLNDPELRRFFNIPEEQLSQQRQVQGVGSGVIIDAAEGLVVTNNHVVENADQIKVNLQDGRTVDATLIGRDAGTDIALLRIEADNLRAVPLSDSSSLRVGDYVMAVGNPFGLGQTVTSGIVSALGRNGLNPGGLEDFIQTDASINPGNSGGALVDLNGNLVGINSAIISQSGGNIGIGFAVPINMAMQVVDQLNEFGEVSRGRLGVYIQDLTPEVASVMGVDVTRGAVVSSVEPGSAAEQAGLLAGDVVTHVNDEVVDSQSDLRNIIGLSRPGTEVEVVVVRDGRSRSFDVVLGGAADAVARNTPPSEASGILQGLQLSAWEEEGSRGVRVLAVAPGSRAEANGLQAGDIITAVNRQSVTTPEEVMSLLNQAPSAVTLNVNRKGQSLFMILR